MLTIQPVLDALGFVDLVEDPVGVVLHGGGEDHHFINLRHLGQKLIAARPHQEGPLAANLKIVYQSLIQIQHQAVAGAALLSRQVGRVRRGEGLVTADGCAPDAVEWGQVRELLEALYLLASFDDMIPHVIQRAIIDILQGFTYHNVEWSQSRPRDVGTLQEPLTAHLKEPLGRHVGIGSGLLALPDDCFQHTHYLLVHLSHAHLTVRLLVLGPFRLLIPLLLYNALQLIPLSAIQLLVPDPTQDNLHCADEVLVNEGEEAFDLLDLDVGGLQNVGGTSVVVDDSDGEDFERHLVSQLFLNPVVLDRLLKLRYHVLILISQLPPV